MQDTEANMNTAITTALNYIDSKLPVKAGLPAGGKRVFIGEYGWEQANFGAAIQDQRSRWLLKSALNWGCPYILYWEMFDNEGIGYHLIDEYNVKQPIYFTHQNYYTNCRNALNEMNSTPTFDAVTPTAISL